MTEPATPSVLLTSDTQKRSTPPRGSRGTEDPNVAHPQSKLTPEIAEEIINAVSVGNRIDVAAAAVGVSRDTLQTWLRKGRHATRGAYFDLAVGIERALASSEIIDLATIHRASEEQWQAAAWKLERRFPDAYGRKTRIEGQVDLRAVPYLDASKLLPEETTELRRLLEKASPSVEDLPRDGRPALELVAGEGTT